MPKYHSIQYLRAVAALMVVFHHMRNPRPWLFNPLETWQTAGAGVDIFFVISGFIMYAAAREESPGDFLQRRCARVWPLYATATLGALLFQYGSHLGEIHGPLLEYVGKSLLFIPQYSLDQPTVIHPYLIVGWTLNLEMFFYVVFALGLIRRQLISTVFTTLLTCVVMGLIFQPHNAFGATYTNPILLEFLMGMLVARWSASLAKRPLAWLVPIALAGFAVSSLFDIPQVIRWGIPAVFLVTGAVAMEQNRMLPKMGLLKKLGDASYSIYLFQWLALSYGLRLAKALPVTGYAQFIITTAITLGAAIVVGLAAYYLLERPIIRYFAGKRSQGVIPAS